MSTIATDRKTMACDDSAHVSGLIYKCGPKFRRYQAGKRVAVVGSVGLLADAVHFFNWFESAFPNHATADRPVRPFDESFTALVLEQDGVLWTVENTLTFMPNENPHFAIGSGRDFAMAAMELGHGPAEAVEVAIQLDAGSNGQVLEVHL